MAIEKNIMAVADATQAKGNVAISELTALGSVTDTADVLIPATIKNSVGNYSTRKLTLANLVSILDREVAEPDLAGYNVIAIPVALINLSNGADSNSVQTALGGSTTFVSDAITTLRTKKAIGLVLSDTKSQLVTVDYVSATSIQITTYDVNGQTKIILSYSSNTYSFSKTVSSYGGGGGTALQGTFIQDLQDITAENALTKFGVSSVNDLKAKLKEIANIPLYNVKSEYDGGINSKISYIEPCSFTVRSIVVATRVEIIIFHNYLGAANTSNGSPTLEYIAFNVMASVAIFDKFSIDLANMRPTKKVSNVEYLFCGASAAYNDGNPYYGDNFTILADLSNYYLDLYYADFYTVGNLEVVTTDNTKKQIFAVGKDLCTLTQDGEGAIVTSINTNALEYMDDFAIPITISNTDISSYTEEASDALNLTSWYNTYRTLRNFWIIVDYSGYVKLLDQTAKKVYKEWQAFAFIQASEKYGTKQSNGYRLIDDNKKFRVYSSAAPIEGLARGGTYTGQQIKSILAGL